MGARQQGFRVRGCLLDEDAEKEQRRPVELQMLFSILLKSAGDPCPGCKVALPSGNPLKVTQSHSASPGAIQTEEA